MAEALEFLLQRLNLSRIGKRLVLDLLAVNLLGLNLTLSKCLISMFGLLQSFFKLLNLSLAFDKGPIREPSDCSQQRQLCRDIQVME